MKPVQILLVEDNPADVMLTEEAFEEATFPHQLHFAKDGVEALAFLRREAGFEDKPTPDVILLDLNMPRLGGLETLAIIKEDAALRHLPVVVLTTSRSEKDIWQSYDLRANAYIPKPVTMSEFSNMVNSFESFWLSTALLPKTRQE